MSMKSIVSFFLVLAFVAHVAAQSAIHTIYGQTWPTTTVPETFGANVAGLGDVDLDGVPDFAVGANNASPNNTQSGIVKIYSGMTGALIRVHNGQQNGSMLSRGLDNAGDVDGDGINDVIAGAPLVLPPLPFGPPNPPGRAFVWSGFTGALVWMVQATTIGDSFGRAVAGIGDIDGDGRADFAVGAPTSNYIQVFSGMTGLLVYTRMGDTAGDMFGTAIAGLGDLDGDGFGDFAVSAPNDDNGGMDTGMVRVFSGATGSIIGSVDGNAAGDFLGRTFMARLGDLDGDGVNEFVVGAPSADQTGTDRGYIRVYSGATLATLVTLFGENNGDFFGRAVSSAGDIDHDGFDDIAVSASSYDIPGMADVGRIYVLSGRTFVEIASFTGAIATDSIGVSLAPVGDINLDTYPDLLIGSSLVDFGGVSNIGRADVVSFGARLSDCAVGGVLDGGGMNFSTLLINGSSGGMAHRVDVGIGMPITLSVLQPPLLPFPAPFILFGCFDVPFPGDATVLPFNIGVMCFPPNLLSPLDPRLFTVANSFVASDPTALIVSSTPAPYSVVSGGLPFPFRITFQGVISDSPGPLSVTNGVILNIE